VPAGWRSGSLPLAEWETFCSKNGVGEWTLVAAQQAASSIDG